MTNIMTIKFNWKNRFKPLKQTFAGFLKFVTRSNCKHPMYLVLKH